MLRQEERIGLILKADREKLRAIDRILTDNDVQRPAQPRLGPEDYRLFTVTDVANKLQVSRPTIYRWIAAGFIPTRKFGKRQRISISTLRELQEGKVKQVVEGVSL